MEGTCLGRIAITIGCQHGIRQFRVIIGLINGEAFDLVGALLICRTENYGVEATRVEVVHVEINLSATHPGYRSLIDLLPVQIKSDLCLFRNGTARITDHP